MGFKRPFNDDEIHGVTCKQTRAPSYDKPLHIIDTDESSNPNKEEEPLEIDGFGVQICHTSLSDKNEDSYSFYLYRSPSKKVAIGSDFQARVLPWEDETHVSDFGGNRCLSSCVIPMPEPDKESNSDPDVGNGRKTCGCSDVGSVRCVRQHIMEAREKLRVSIGHENFVDLGFYEMGEEVACHWSEEDERSFNRIVYSNPSSLGLSFWRRLSEAFPSRTKKEIVSYYFNVFMLRKRASQNRSAAEIDSDDDEFHGAVRTPGNPRIDSIVVIDSSDESDGDELNNDGDVESDEAGEDSGIDSGLDLYELNVCDSGKSGSAKEAPVEEDSCVSFEFSAKVGAGGSVNEPNQKRVPSLFLFDACDSKLWDSQCTNVKGVDFLPTSNIIDEIFGKENCNLPDHGINH